MSLTQLKLFYLTNYSYYLDYPILFLFFNKRILNKKKLICDYILMIIIVNLIT
jgi:hypothetical protein